MSILVSSDSDTNGKYQRGELLIDHHKVELLMGDNSDYDSTLIDIPKYNDNTWHHIVVSINGYKQTVYFDGKKIGTYTLSVSAGTASDYTYSIGRNGENDSGYFKGQIAQVRVFLGKALSEDEVRKLYVEDSKYVLKSHLRTILTDLNNDSNQKLYPYVYTFEGQHIVDLSDKQVTLSFDFASNLTGDFTLSLVNNSQINGGKESYVTKFSYNNNNGEFEKIKVTIDMSEFEYLFRDDENLGASLYIATSTESDKTDTEGRQDGYYVYLEDTKVLDKGDWVRITNVQLEEGSVATEFEKLPYKIQLDRCLRYYYFKNTRVTMYRAYTNTDYKYLTYHYPMVMRNNPLIKCNIENSDDIPDISRITNKQCEFQYDSGGEDKSAFIENIELDAEL